EVTIQTSNNGNPTSEGVEVTLTVDEDIRMPGEWTPIDNRTFTRKYENNVNENVTIFDNAGNSLVKTIVVTGIDKDAPILNAPSVTRNGNGTYTITGSANEPLTGVEVSVNSGLFVAGAVNGAIWSF